MQYSLLYMYWFDECAIGHGLYRLKDGLRGNGKHVCVQVHCLVLAELSAGYPPIQLGKPPT